MDRERDFTKNTKSLSEKSREIEEKKDVEIGGVSLVVYKDVFDPSVFFSSQQFGEILREYVKDKNIQTFCEIGTGTGLVSVFVALENPDLSLTISDVNPNAVENAKENVEKHNLSARVTVFESDVFSAFEGRRFDAIFWALPFGHLDSNESIDYVGMQTFDPGYRAIEKYFAEGDRYLNPDGELLYVFSDKLGNRKLLDEILDKNGWKSDMVSEAKGFEGEEEIVMPVFSAKKISSG